MKSFKDFGNKLMTKMVQHKNTAAIALATGGLMPVMASAQEQGSTPPVGGKTKDSASTMVTDIASVVVDIFPLIGIFFVISGVFKLVMAYRNDQPEAQTAAAKDIVIGVVFILFRVFIWEAVKSALK